MSSPKEDHMLAAKRVLRYLKGTTDLGLFYKKEADPKLKAYTDTDSDYAGDVDDRKSTSGYVFLMSGAAVCWSSRKQAVVTLSSTETEYVAATSCACHCVWAKGMLDQIQMTNSEGVERCSVTTFLPSSWPRIRLCTKGPNISM
ncbi:unnamed protein product [Rhodiola kirilowii]